MGAGRGFKALFDKRGSPCPLKRKEVRKAMPQKYIIFFLQKVAIFTLPLVPFWCFRKNDFRLK